MEEVSLLFKKKKSIFNFYLFLLRLYYSEKIIELCSFIVWELKYRLSLYKKKQILKFTNQVPLISIVGNEFEFDKVKYDNFKISQCEYIWSLLYLDNSKNIWGCTYENDSLLRVISAKRKQLASFRFDHKLEGLFINSLGHTFCCSNGILYKSVKFEAFKKVLEFSTSYSHFRKEAFTETPDGTLLIGEYANIPEGKSWKFVGHIYYSHDNGERWNKTDFLKKAGINKHVHIIKWSKLIRGLILTDGDNQKNIWVNMSKNYCDRLSPDAKSGWKKINKNHIQKGGYTAIAEINGKIFFGTDYNGGTNFLVTTSNLSNFTAKVVPDPYRRSIFGRIIVRDNGTSELEIWATLVFIHSKTVKSLLLRSKDYGLTWEKIIEYDGTRFELRIISMSNNVEKELYILLKNKIGLEATTLRIHNQPSP